jgi:hypothetical protein
MDLRTWLLVIHYLSVERSRADDASDDIPAGIGRFVGRMRSKTRLPWKSQRYV